jgi:long-subunit acyl-CoA synthetase (AMP-forming)
MSLTDRLAMHALRRPEHPALAWPEGQMGYRALLQQVEAAAALLRQTGVGVLALDVENAPAWVVLDIAAMQLGVCLIPLPPFFSPGQLHHVLRRSATQAVLTDDPQRLRERLGEHLVDAESSLQVADRALTWIDTRESVEAGKHSVPEGVNKITFTSGTTGEPKGVMLSWAQIRPVVESLEGATAMGPGDRHLTLMPLAVLLENIAGVYAPLWAGASVMLLPMAKVGLSGSSGLNGETMALALSESRATTAIFTPQTLQGGIDALDSSPAIPLALRFAAVGGAPVSPRLLQRAAELGLPVFEGYGLSECASVVCLNTPAHHRPGSVGRPLPHLQLTLSDDGEVLVHGQPFVGYLGEDPPASGRWPTGDLGELDDDGFLYLHGRRRNMFITAFGRNVAPEWVERELMLEPAILQAAVFGEARPYNVAVVVPGPGATPSDIEVAFARTNRTLPDYARVSRWLPADAPFAPANGLLTGTGRIRRTALLERYGQAIELLYCEARTS